MAKSTFLELCKKVRSECGLSGTGPAAVTSQSGMDAKIVSWVADADVEIQSLWLDWDFLHVDTWFETTVIGTAAVPAPADIGAWDMDSFFLDYNTSTYQQLSTMDYKVWRNTARNGVKTNTKPSFVVVKPDQSLILEAPPDAVYLLTADYWQIPVKMTANGDTSAIPQEFERVLIARAKMMYAEHDSANDIMLSSQVEYDYLLDRMEAKYLSSQAHRRYNDPGKLTVIVQ